MPVLTFPCPVCSKAMRFEYADYDFKDWIRSNEDHFEVLKCNGCGKTLKTVPWIAVIDEETEQPITFV